MASKEYKKFLNVILGIVIVAIIAVVAYIIYEYVYLRNKIDSNANEILGEFDKYMNTINNENKSDENSENQEEQTNRRKPRKSGTNRQ